MNHRRLIAAVGLAGVLALAACGTDDQITQPAQPASASHDAAAAFQHYYDVTRPQQPASASQDAAAAFQHYYDVTHPAPESPKFNGDAKDHRGYNPEKAGATAVWPGDAKDHPRYAHIAPGAIAVSNGDAKDHPGYGQIQWAGGAVQALRTAVSPSQQDPRAVFLAEVASFAENEGLTGLSPAYLQPIGRTLVGNPR